MLWISDECRCASQQKLRSAHLMVQKTCTDVYTACALFREAPSGFRNAIVPCVLSVVTLHSV